MAKKAKLPPLSPQQKAWKEKCTIRTPKFRLSYPHLIEPQEQENGKPKYNMAMIFDADTDLTAVKTAITNAMRVKYGANKEDWPEGWRRPIRDADKEAKKTKKPVGPEYKGKLFIGASAQLDRPPELYDADKTEIDRDSPLAAKKFYAGCYCKAVIQAFAYEHMGKIGVSFGIEHVQWVGKGEKIGGKTDASKYLEDESEDEDSDSDDDSDDMDEDDMDDDSDSDDDEDLDD